MSLLSASDYPAIRALVDSALTKDQLPDDVIALDVFIGTGQDMVLRRDPDAETRTGADLQRARRAAMLFTASLLVSTALQRVQTDYTEGPGGEVVRYQTSVKPGARAEELRALAMAEIDAYLTVTEETAAGTLIDPPSLFATTRPKRCAGFFLWPPAGWDGR